MCFIFWSQELLLHHSALSKGQKMFIYSLKCEWVGNWIEKKAIDSRGECAFCWYCCRRYCCFYLWCHYPKNPYECMLLEEGDTNCSVYRFFHFFFILLLTFRISVLCNLKNRIARHKKSLEQRQADTEKCKYWKRMCLWCNSPIKILLNHEQQQKESNQMKWNEM